MKTTTKNSQKKMASLEKKEKDFENELRSEIIKTPYGDISLFQLVKNIGIKEKVIYYNDVENKQYPGTTEKKIFDYGFIFTDGLEIRGIMKKYFSKINGFETIEKRERIPGLKPFPTNLPFD